MRILASEIIRVVAEDAGLTVRGLTGARRTRPYAAARFRACVLIRRLRPEMSTTLIGQRLGGRDHSTIVNALKRGQARIAADAAEAARVAQLERRMLECQPEVQPWDA